MPCFPTYDDLGKTAKEFFSKGYYLDIFKLCGKKERAIFDVDTRLTCTHNFTDSTAVVEFETKYKYSPWGLSASSTIDTKNMLAWKLDVTDKIARGLKVALDGDFNLETAAKTAKAGATYKIDQATFDLGFSGGDENNMTIGGSAVSGYNGFLGGYQFAYDTNEGVLKKNNLALGYCGNGLAAHASMDNVETLSAVLLYRLKNNMDIGLNGTYTSGDDTKTRYGFGLRYNASPCTSFKAKIDNTRTITLACEMKATDAATVTLCAQVDGANAGKVGAACEFCT